MPKPYKQDNPRNWKKWREQDMLGFIAQTLADEDDSDESTESVIAAMLDELDTRDEVRNARFPDDWDEDDITVPSYLS